MAKRKIIEYAALDNVSSLSFFEDQAARLASHKKRQN
jgi:hypothetical protein